MEDPALSSSRNFESVYMWVTSETSGEGGYAVAPIIRELANKSLQMEAQLAALKQTLETIQHANQDKQRRTLSEEKGSESIPTLVGDTNYRVWKFKVVTFIAEKYPKCKDILEALDNKKEITDEDMEEWRALEPGVRRFSNELYSLLVKTSDSKATLILMNLDAGNGLEAWRRFSCEFGAKTETTDEALMSRMMNWPRCSNLDEVPLQIEKFELVHKEYMLRCPEVNLGKGFKKSMLKKIIPESLKKTIESQMDLNVTEQQLRAYIRTQVDLNKKTKSMAMDIGAVQGSEKDATQESPMYSPCGCDLTKMEEQQQWADSIDAVGKGGGKGKGVNNPNYAGCWWCGMKNHLGADCRASPEKVQEYQNKKGKGKGDKGKGKGKGQIFVNHWGNWSPPYYGYGKSGNKGKGKGVYGMESSWDWWGPQVAPQPLASMTSSPTMIGGIRDICAITRAAEDDEWETIHNRSKVKMARVKGGRKAWKKLDLKNAFSGLATSSDDDEDEDDETPGLKEPPSHPHFRDCPCGRWRTHKEDRCECGNKMFFSRSIDEPPDAEFTRSRRQPVDEPKMEICNVAEEQWIHVETTIDSGAAETVCNPETGSDYNLVETQASKSGQHWVSASGDPIMNYGERKVVLATNSGDLKTMRYQVADVTKPLASVARICQAGHRVVFDSDGSYIEDKGTGHREWLREHNGTYVMDTWIMPAKQAEMMMMRMSNGSNQGFPWHSNQ